jgi:hypothetical protein
MPRPTIVLALAGAALLAGCGNARTQPPEVATPGPPLGSDAVRYPAAGVAFQAPAGWRRQDAPVAPLIVSVSTGSAVLSVFRYPRSEPLPTKGKALRAAVAALAGAAKQRDATVVAVKRSTLTVDGKPAVVLRATETVAGLPRTVRSTHVYADGGEVVIDAMAPAADFKRVDAEVFRPVVRSLKLSKPTA